MNKANKITDPDKKKLLKKLFNKKNYCIIQCLWYYIKWLQRRIFTLVMSVLYFELVWQLKN